MANEIRATGATGLTLYAVIRNASNQIWNGSAFEAYNASNYATYDVALTEQGATGRYAADFPAGIVTAGVYYPDVRKQAGGSPAVSDLSLGEAEIVWNGSAEVVLSGLKLETAMESDGAVYRFTTNALEQAPSGGGGGDIYGEAGSIVFTYTVFDTNGTTPLEGVSVFVSSDISGVNRSQAKLTDDLGQVQFSLNPGTVYFWRERFDRTFTDPDTETVGL